MTSYINDHPSFNISPAYDIPLSLKNLLSEIWAQQYQEHSKEHDGDATTSLSDAFTNVLDALWPESISVHAGHKRYVWMAYALGFTIGPTINRDPMYKQQAALILMGISRWLRGKTAALDFPREEELNASVIEGELAMDEARSVLQNLRKITDPAEARTALLQILDDCFEGYTVLQDVYRRRDFFHWWLVEVVPAAWCMRLPKVIYQAG
jgi:hypothetical protein